MNTEATKAYQEKQEEITALIEILQAQVNETPKEIHWGHVGDLGYIKDQLENIIR